MIKRMTKNIFLLLFFLLNYGQSETQITAPTPCTIPSCKQYGGVILVDPTTGSAYSASGTTGGATSINQTNGTQQTKITNGTQTADTIAGNVAGQNALLVAGSNYYATGLTTSGTVNTAAIDASNFNIVTVQITAIAGNTITFQDSIDCSTYTTKLMYLKTSANSGATGTSTTTGQYTAPISAKCFRLSASGGSSTYSIMLGSGANGIHTLQSLVNQTGVWSVGSIPVASVAAANSPLNGTSAAYEASRAVKASSGVLYSIACYNSKASAQWVLLFNTTAVPADATTTNAVPIYCAATSNCSADYGNYGKFFSTGISWSNSSTSPTKTIGSSDVFCDARYQ